MFVARVKQIKEETVSLMEFSDLENLIVLTTGEDVWLAILEFTQSKVEELEEEIKDLKGDGVSDDGQLYSLRTGIRDSIAELQKLIVKVEEVQRLDRRSLVKTIRDIIKELENNEGYI